MSAIIKYGETTISEIENSEVKTLKTAGKYCEKDISVTLIKEDGGNQDIMNKLVEFYTTH